MGGHYCNSTFGYGIKVTKHELIKIGKNKFPLTEKEVEDVESDFETALRNMNSKIKLIINYDDSYHNNEFVLMVYNTNAEYESFETLSKHVTDHSNKVEIENMNKMANIINKKPEWMVKNYITE